MASTNYSSGPNMAGGLAVGISHSTNYVGFSGIVGFAVQAGDSTSPVISNFKIDGRTVVNGDYIKKDATLTATVTDETALSLTTSSIEVDGVGITFNSLSGTSSYDATTGLLTYRLNITADGNHTITIKAMDISGNSSTLSRTTKIDTGELKALSVYVYPNPYRGIGNMAIGYQLNKNADTAIYIFNAIGRLIFKRTYISGAEGAHIGYNEITWDAKDDFGNLLSNDVYFLRVVSDGKPVGRTKIAVIK